VPPDEDNGAACTKSAPAKAFKPVLKWSWTLPVEESLGSLVIPLVGNFTDDNGDGKIDLCDTPDVLVTHEGGKIVMLAGNDGHEEGSFDGIDPHVTPAFGDLDGDGIPELVTNDPAGFIVVFANDGTVKWRGDAGTTTQPSQAIAIYDLDADGSPEIIGGFDVFDARGKRLFGHDLDGAYSVEGQASTAADLDGDGKLEVIFGNAAYHADGTIFWTSGGPPGQPHVANLDADPEPEVILSGPNGITILEHDGRVKLGPTKFAGDPQPNCWSKPGAVHDFDGDGIADILISTCTKYVALKVAPDSLTPIWSADINDESGIAASTAFDFLGRGTAQAVYGDETSLWVFDGKTGVVDFHEKRRSVTLIEYPVIAGIDNDQSADIVVVSNRSYDNVDVPIVQVFEDAEKRWVPTRRIWNQHAYHVTNVREDGTIPRVMKKSWQLLNTFRANAQIEGNGECLPPSNLR
jgi:hypothetical protein